MALINTTTTGVLGSTFYGDGTGSLTVQQNGVTQGIYGNIPAFQAYRTSDQTITTSTFTKVTLNAEVFDTNNNFDTTLNRFTPTIAGYYQISHLISAFNSTTPTRLLTTIYKNGSQHSYGSDSTITTGISSGGNSVLIYFNGTTDYVELYAYITAGTAVVSTLGSPIYTHLCGFLAKAT